MVADNQLPLTTYLKDKVLVLQDQSSEFGFMNVRNLLFRLSTFFVQPALLAKQGGFLIVIRRNPIQRSPLKLSHGSDSSNLLLVEGQIFFGREGL